MTDITVATDVDEPALPPARPVVAEGTPTRARRPHPDHDDSPTLYADPVEQAILVDRTRQVRLPAATTSASAESGSIALDATVDATVAEPSPAGASASRAAVNNQPIGPSASGVLVAVTGEDLLGNYRMVAPLAEGGMGVLYRGEHRFLGYPVAIKILQPSLRGDPEVESRFFAEALATARIPHPGVPTVLDFGHDRRGTAYLVMEYLSGDTLAAHMARGECFTVAQVLEIGAQLANILAAAHARGVVHRDIKPDNIYLVPDPSQASGVRVKLLDFGVAKLVRDRPAGAVHFTRSDFVIGTAWYMAPEQSSGPGDVDARCDVYALGCVLFQLLTGRLPFIGEPSEVVEARRTRDAPPVRTFRPELAAGIEGLLARMLARLPEDRTQSMDEVESQLGALLTSERLAAPPPSASHWVPAEPPAPGSRELPMARPPSACTGALPALGGLAGRARGAVARHPHMTVAVVAATLAILGLCLSLI